MIHSIVINLGAGNLFEGYPVVSVGLWALNNPPPQQFVGNLPPAPNLVYLYHKWRLMYQSLCQRLASSWMNNSTKNTRHFNLLQEQDEDDELEIYDSEITNVSVVDFNDLCQKLQKDINNWLESPGIINISRQVRATLNPADEIQIIIETQDITIQKLPWHACSFFQDYPHAEISFSKPEYKRNPRFPLSGVSRDHVRILAILGNSQRINLENERRFLQSLPDAEVEFLVKPSRQEFNDKLWDFQGWDMLFFAGHSQTEHEKGIIYINENPTNNSLTIEELAEAFKAAIKKSLKLAIFNSSAGLGLAHSLEKLNMPATIVMHEALPNRVAEEFFNYFLQAFAFEQKSLYMSVQQARRRLQGLEDDFFCASWLPVIFTNPASEPPNWVTLKEKFGEQTRFNPTQANDESTTSKKHNYEPEPSTETVKVKTRLWYFGAEPSTTNLPVGEDLTLNLTFTPNSQPGSSIRVPANTLELTVYIEAPGFYLQGEHTRTLPVRDGELMERSLTLNFTPLISGNHTISLSVYPGGRLPNLNPEKLPIKVRVNTPIVLPNIPELIDRQAIPAPQPNIILHVTLEEVLNKEQSTGRQRVGLYFTCLALECDRKPLEPLYFTANDLERLRQSVIQAALVANGSPVDVLTSLRAIGATLFDRLMPPGHQLRDYYWKLFNLSDSDTQLSWLIVSEAKAVLPWELVCAYYYDQDMGKNWYDEFLAQKFIIAHWVGYQGLKLANEAPLLKLGLTHYNQRPEHLSRWQKVLGSEAQAESNQKSGLLDLMQPSSSCYGLHVLRYTDLRQTGQITSYKANTEFATGKTPNQAEELLYSQRLDFTLRRPVVGLSMVDGQMANGGMAMSGSDNQLEAAWMLPLMHAGASALVGSRWSVLPESDRLFYRTFYNLIRTGTELGWAVWQARKQLRVAFPHRSDWLAYTYFGHPQCQPYLVRESQGFTFFEAINPPENDNFQPGKSYQFRASYRSEAPLWYSGRLSVQQRSAEPEDLSVMVVCLTGEIPPQTYQLQPVDFGDSYQHIITITMPAKDTILPFLIRFQKGSEELNTLFLNLNEVKRGES